VAALELLSPLFNHGGSLVCLTLIFVVFVIAPKRCGFRDWQRVLPSALISAAGALATFLLANYLNLGPLVASAVVGLAGTSFFKERHQLVLYLGAFVGMSSDARFPSLTLLIAAGLVGGVLWEVLNETWNGVGGRLGTVAATAVLVVLLTLGGGL
jgi:NhaP-type Na+/H+ or K+/H+ antiporter